MALGSVATVAVLGLAIWQAPKFLGAKANTSAPLVQPQDPKPEPAVAKPEPEPVVNPEPQQTPPPVATSPNVTPTPGNPRRIGEGGQTSAGSPIGGQRPLELSNQRPNPSPAPVQTPVETPQQTQVQQQPPPRPSGPDPAQLNELRKQYNLLSIRASSVKGGVQQMQAQMGGQSLRAEIREAVTRIDYLMSEAMQSIQSGDINGARQNLQYAERTVEQVEKFLGR